MLAALANAMADRYFSEQPICGTELTLSGGEAHHLIHVMRAKPGTRLNIFDGSGGEWRAEVTQLGRSEVVLSLGEFLSSERELDREITVAVALPKGDRQRWLVEKCVELGVARIVPLKTARSTVSSPDSPARLLRYVIEASKQCGRNRLMQCTEAVRWASFVTDSVAELRLAAHPGGLELSSLDSTAPASTMIAVGPEGGFTEEEIAVARDCNWEVVDLGTRILRIETAAVALVARLTM